MELVKQQRIGLVVPIEDPSIDNLNENLKKIEEALKANGLVVIKGASLSAGEMIELAKQLGDELVHIPPEMLKDNVEVGHPEIVRVGNLLPNGGKRDSKKEGDHWH